MNIGDKVEVSITGRLTKIEEDIWDFSKGVKRIMYTLKVGEGNPSYTITVPVDAIVKVEA